ncbi:hypothetical protein JCM18382A_09550 [Bradyrhizobium sp. 17-4]
MCVAVAVPHLPRRSAGTQELAISCYFAMAQLVQFVDPVAGKVWYAAKLFRVATYDHG